MPTGGATLSCVIISGQPKRERSLSAAAIAAALLVSLSACTDAETSSVGSGVDRDGSVQAEQFAGLYDQQIEWYECGEDEGLDDYTAEALDAAGFDLDQIGCAYVLAPLDWDDPTNEEHIELSIVHIPATGDGELGTLLGNPGGPGSTGVDFMFGMALAPGFEKITASYDLLGFDPRGIGASTPIECDDSASQHPVLQLGRCIAENPLTHTMGTSQVARDMELLRALMGDEKLNYLGYSYGTMLGASYASLFPERVGQMVLDSAENAEWASPTHLFDQQVAMANATLALATSCTTEYDGEVESCPFVDEQTLMSVIADLNANPLIATDGSTVSGWGLRDFLFGALYSSHFERGRALDMIALALFGDQESIDSIANEVSGQGADYGMKVVTCHSFPIEPDIEGLLEHVEEVGMPRLLGGPEINDETLMPFVDLSCYALPESGLDFSERYDASDAGPILVIGITGDHATPFQFAEKLTEELGNAQLLTLDGQGHAASYDDRSQCIDHAVSQYLLEGTLPRPGAVCVDD